jgi:hypothetical protein
LSSRRSPTGQPAAGSWALAVAALLLAWPLAGGARGVYLTAEEFLAQAFGSAAPQPATLWLSEDVKRRATAILDHPPAQLRVRYWRAGGRTAWILDEIGKTHPITIGTVVEDGAIVAIRVLEFRESRGSEVRLPFFTEQFAGIRLRGDDARQLDHPIDGITGATLSVRAMRKVARLALLFHQEVMDGGR